MNFWCPTIKRKGLLCEFAFIPTDRGTLIVKMVKKEAFLMKPKHQCHLSQLGEYVYGSSSWKERRLLCESMLIQIERHTSILKLVIGEAFYMKPKHQYH